MTDTTATHYEVTYRHAERAGRVRERFHFEDGRYGQARAAAYARVQELATKGAHQIHLDVVTRRRVSMPI
jgi:hypothetical protein